MIVQKARSMTDPDELESVLAARRLVRQIADPESRITAEGRFVLHCIGLRLGDRAGALVGDWYRYASYLAVHTSGKVLQHRRN
jgi:hypothetical protein